MGIEEKIIREYPKYKRMGGCFSFDEYSMIIKSPMETRRLIDIRTAIRRIIISNLEIEPLDFPTDAFYVAKISKGLEELYVSRGKRGILFEEKFPLYSENTEEAKKAISELLRESFCLQLKDPLKKGKLYSLDLSGVNDYCGKA